MKYLLSSRLVAVMIGFLLASLSAIPQSQEPVALRFEVAAIKPSAPGQPNSGSFTPGNTFRLMNTPLKQWVERAFSVRDYALKAPSWLDESRFDLNAEIPATNMPPKSKETNEMLRTLLIERFGLKWHEERGTTSGYELVVGKKLLMKPWDPSDPIKGGRSRGPAVIQGHNMPTADLAADLGEVLGMPVVDSTHLSGGFNVKLIWRPDDEAAVASSKQLGLDVSDLPSLLTALQEQLGLQLRRAQVPSVVIVVDNINRQPTNN